jgi:hypothetical protein
MISDNRPQSDSDRFAREAAGPARSILREMWDLLRLNKKWWLVPIVIVLLVVGTLSVLAASGLAPLIYTFF